MGQSAIRLFTLVITATMLAGAAPPAIAKASHNKQIKAHRMHVHRGPGGVRTADWTRTAAGHPAAAAAACPGGISRSFECGRWPPPIDEDPDRVISGAAAD